MLPPNFTRELPLLSVPFSVMPHNAMRQDDANVQAEVSE